MLPLERGLVRVRWFAVAFGLFQVSQLNSGTPRPPHGIVAASYVTIAFLGIGNALIRRLSGRTQDARTLRRIGFGAFLLDGAVILTNVWLGSYDRYGAGWVIAYILPLEAAVRYELRGAFASIAVFSVSELARELYRGSLFPDLGFQVSSVTFRAGIFAIIALVAGIMARNLGREREAAEQRAEELAQLAESNARLLAHERQTVERLRELDTMKSDFVAVTSHELRTPLTAVHGFIKTLRRPELSLSSSEVQELLAIVERQTERLTRLVQDLLLSARIEAGTIDLHMASIDVASVLTESLDDLDTGRERVQLVVDPAMEHIVTDGGRLAQIARNLIENALKFSDGSSRVRVTALAESAGSLLIEVADQGAGIPEDELSQVFDRFHQVGDPLQRGTRGLGLGLYIVRNLVDALNGSVEVRSVVGEGTTFSVRLPLVLASSAEAETGA
jgi:signal transduction histidine kinase